MRPDWDWVVIPVTRQALEKIIYKLAQQEWAKTKGGRFPAFVVRDEGALQAALREPYQRFEGQWLYPSIPEMAACLFRGLVKDHPLIDGNKRVGVTAMSVFLSLNGYETTYTNLQLQRYALRVARHHGAYPLPLIVKWVRRNSRRVGQQRLATLISMLFWGWKDEEAVELMLSTQQSPPQNPRR